MADLRPLPRPPLRKAVPLTELERKPLPRVFAFVDESGDRNFKDNRQSDFFSMTAVLVAEEHLLDLRVAIGGLRTVFGVGSALHWKDHCRAKHRSRRDLVARTMARVPGVRVVHTVWDKAQTRSGSYVSTDQGVAYHWVTKFPTELVALAAQNWEGGPRSVILNFGVVGGVQHDETLRYLEKMRRTANRKTTHILARAVPWENIAWPPQWLPAAQRDGLQAADLYSGMLTAAVKDDCGEWLLATSHQLFRHAGRFDGLGIKTLPTRGLLEHRPWWSQL